jgi:AraC-like DNA-binding protein
MLRFQLKSLLLRVLLSNNKTIDTEFDSTQISRFRRFKNLVEEKFCIQHKVADYANQLGCTVKSLSRATQASAAIGAKQYIAARIILEAKRLLTHTQMPISVIADQLGFDEPTNFVKFFKREGSLAPNEFRKQNYSIYN